MNNPEDNITGSHRLPYEFMENLWRWKVGMPEKDLGETPMKDIIKLMPWNWEFIVMMWRRLIFGGYRYGRPRDGRRSLKQDYVAALNAKLRRYVETGNLEMLVDVANYALLEFLQSEHPKKHFESIDDKDHCPEVI